MLMLSILIHNVIQYSIDSAPMQLYIKDVIYKGNNLLAYMKQNVLL